MEQNSITKYSQSQQPTTLPLERLSAAEVYPSQLKLWQGLKASSISTMVAAQTPTLAKIKNEASEMDVRALLYIAVCEVCDFFNVGKNMSDSQIAITVDLILERFWYFHLEEIKYCFRRAMMYEKVFDRLDGNMFLNWLTDYDVVRTEEAMRMSEQEESRSASKTKDSSQAISFEEYIANLRERAKTDNEAMKLLNSIENPKTHRITFLTRDERAEKEHDFKLWKMLNYLKRDTKQ